jgi:hypothetical protein
MISYPDQLMPALKNPSLVVLDNASYHNVKAEDMVCPNCSQKKAVLQNYLTQHNIPFSQFSLQYSFSILTTCSSAFVYTSFVVLNTSCPCKLAILSVLCTTGVFFCFIFSYNTF